MSKIVNTFSCIMWNLVLLSSLTWIPSQAISYNHLDLLNICPKNGGKKEVRMGERPAILSLVANSFPFDCHLELEVSNGLGIHLFIEEMNLLGDESHDCPEDYIQFKRDVLAFTTHRSPRFCGKRVKENHSTPIEGMSPHSRGGSAQRLYIEEHDFEMDFLVHLSQASNIRRNLTVVVTPFRKGCRPNHSTYKQCSHTSHCIHRDLFCDSQPNCAWPSGNVSDEKFCVEISESFFDLSNLPVIIVVVLVIGFILVIFLLAICHVNECSKRRGEPAVPLLSLTQAQPPPQVHPDLRHGNQRGPASAPPESSRNSTVAPFVTDFGPKASTREGQPLTPPSYEDAILHPNRYPPPYSLN
ncbi:hypothetical protein TCAL_02520 [Tigriopus californicus]|uniref:CUB domain-containing protein n=1 Tax=Tigriopus californicus TaxID=6832 RepID=A0A553NST5_TIGCA|nr:uncharacterized protein LOC131892609 [Tigriopus californicus]TRY68479.1 hypothetical protein TCAL_02520 [Tigriopus californicus]|eukprot:TCALIF_02520-PA protein Name:"Protein of unknown function" AED:0.23 eAED:0.26 QI:0/-1/0/1/-1/1/1/0/355